jgi:23S rRNA (adenosine1067-2'-O)-methyltransferase
MTPASTSQTELDSRTASRVVDSLLHPQAILIRRLLTRAGRGEHGELILVDDAQNITQALRAGLAVRSVFHAKDAVVCPNMQQRLPPGVLNYQVARRTCKKLFGNDRLSRIFAIAEAPPARSLDALLPLRRDIVVLDGIGISGNIGAIIRTCAAMGVAAIVILNAESADIFDRRVIRASRGYVFALPVIATTLDKLVDFCALQGVPLVVTQPRGGTAVSAISSLSRPLTIICGGEKRGPSPVLIEAATLRVEIPMSAAVESLNVAAAAAITLYCRYGFNAARLTL